MTEKTLPLDGIRVLDLSRLLPGPFCSQLLADLGAEVIKIEEPPHGDYIRVLEPKVGAESGYFLQLNRNKKSMKLSLNHVRGREIFFRLVKTSDVVIESYRPGVAKSLGIEYDELRTINPRIIYCSISGFGQTGPYCRKPGHDINFLAYSGILSLTTDEYGRPVLPGTQFTDLSAALYALISILTALLQRMKTGKGQHCDVAMLDSAVSFLPLQAAEFFAIGTVSRILTGGSAGYNIYETKDGKYIAVGAIEPKFWARLCKALECEKFIEADSGLKNQEELKNQLEKIFLKRTRDEWIALLNRFDVCSAPVYQVGEVFADEHVRARKMVLETTHPSAGQIRLLGNAIKFSEIEYRAVQIPPALGQHTAELLTQLGYTEDEIAEMKKEGVI